MVFTIYEANTEIQVCKTALKGHTVVVVACLYFLLCVLLLGLLLRSGCSLYCLL